MARPLKDGVDYFPFDTNFYADDKVRLLRAEFGAKGMYLLNYLLCEIYGKNGYFIKWDNSRCFLVSDGAGCGCSPEYIREFISGALRCSFFDERVFKLFGVLTSSGIQRRYLRMFNSRDYIVMIEEYWLLNVNDKKDVPTGVLNKLAFKKVFGTENPDKTTENPFKSTGNPQSKVKDTNVSQRESKKGRKLCPTLSEIKTFISNEKLKINPEKFYYYYQNKKWQGVSDWKAKAKEWNATELNKKSTFANTSSINSEKLNDLINAEE